MEIRCPNVRIGEVKRHLESSQILSNKKMVRIIPPSQAVHPFSKSQAIAENPQIVGDAPNSFPNFVLRILIYFGIQKRSLINPIMRRKSPVEAIPAKAGNFFLASSQGKTTSRIGNPRLGLSVRRASVAPPQNHFSLYQRIAAIVAIKRNRALNCPPNKVVVVGRKMMLAMIIGKSKCLECWKFCARRRRMMETRMRTSEINVHAINAVLRGNAPSGERKIAKGRGYKKAGAAMRSVPNSWWSLIHSGEL